MAIDELLLSEFYNYICFQETVQDTILKHMGRRERTYPPGKYSRGFPQKIAFELHL